MSTQFELSSVGIALAGAFALTLVGFLHGASVDGPPSSTADRASSGPASFKASLELKREIQLEEPDSALIGELTSLDRGPQARFAVVDRISGRVSIYGGSGKLLHHVGRPGEGPSEFLRPVDATILQDETLAIVETGQPRVTLYDPETEHAQTIRLRDAFYGVAVGEIKRGLVVYVNGPDRQKRQLQVYNRQGQLTDRFHRVAEEYYEVPYWSALTKRLLAIKGNEEIIAGANLTLPFVRYRDNGTIVDSLARNLPGWHPVPRPALGQFTGPDARLKFEKWRRTFPTVDAIEIYRSSYLLVAVERLNPAVLSAELGEYELHVFDLVTGRFLGSTGLPGRLLHAGDRIYSLVAEPPVGWVVAEFELAFTQDEARVR